MTIECRSFVDLCLHLNDLNRKLKFANKTIVVIFYLIIVLNLNYKFYIGILLTIRFTHFPNTHTHTNLQIKNLVIKHIKVFSVVIQSMINEFLSRFMQFKRFAET